VINPAQSGGVGWGLGVKRELVQANPFAALPIDKGVTKRKRVPDDDELGEILLPASRATLWHRHLPVDLTGQRGGEVAAMTWRELPPTWRRGPYRTAHQERRRYQLPQLFGGAIAHRTAGN
jgi:integrase